MKNQNLYSKSANKLPKANFGPQKGFQQSPLLDKSNKTQSHQILNDLPSSSNYPQQYAKNNRMYQNAQNLTPNLDQTAFILPNSNTQQLKAVNQRNLGYMNTQNTAKVNANLRGMNKIPGQQQTHALSQNRGTNSRNISTSKMGQIMTQKSLPKGPQANQKESQSGATSQLNLANKADPNSAVNQMNLSNVQIKQLQQLNRNFGQQNNLPSNSRNQAYSKGQKQRATGGLENLGPHYFTQQQIKQNLENKRNTNYDQNTYSNSGAQFQAQIFQNRSNSQQNNTALFQNGQQNRLANQNKKGLQIPASIINRADQKSQQQMTGGLATVGSQMGRNQYANDPQKTLYSNVSLRDVSASPDSRNQLNVSATAQQQLKGSKKAKKIMIMNNEGQNSRNNQASASQFISQKRLAKNASQDGVYQDKAGAWQPQQVGKKPQTNDFNQKNKTGNQIRGNNSQQPHSRNSNNLNQAVLNIKTVQDINIYNNSFIVNTNGNFLPQNEQQDLLYNLTQQQQAYCQENEDASEQAERAQAPQKRGLKLRKQLSGLSNGFVQSRSASQGRAATNPPGQSSSITQPKNDPSLNKSRNNGSLIENNTYGGGAPSGLEPRSKAFDAYSNQQHYASGNILQNVMNPIMNNYAANPNQKRLIPNASGNLVTGLHIGKQGGSNNKKQRALMQQLQTGPSYYQNPKQLRQGLKNIINKKSSSNSSRIQSRTESRNAGLRTSHLPENPKIHMKYGVPQTNPLTSGGRASSHLDANANNHYATQMNLMNIHDLNNQATDLNTSNLSNISGPQDFNGTNQMHSQSQVLISQLHQPQKNYNNNQSQQVVVEGRLQSLNDIQTHNIAGKKENKFRNQIQQSHSDVENTPLNQAKDDRSFKLKTAGNVNKNQQQQEQSPVNQKFLNQMQQLVQENQDKYKVFSQNYKKIIKVLEKDKLSDGELTTSVQQLHNFQAKAQVQIDMLTQNMKYYQDYEETQSQLQKIIDSLNEMLSKCIVLRGLCNLDKGLTHECLNDFNYLTDSTGLRNQFYQPQGNMDAESDQNMSVQMVKTLKSGDQEMNSYIMKSIAQRRIGEHDQAQNTLTECINIYSKNKTAYFIRGQAYLLQKKPQRALQDLIQYSQLIQVELKEKKGPKSNSHLLEYQNYLGLELLGDTYKKIKHYKLSQEKYNQALAGFQELSKVDKLSNGINKQRVQTTIYKVRQKIAMCDYYQGKMDEAMRNFDEILSYYEQFDQKQVQVQQRIIKCNFYRAKAMIAKRDQKGCHTVEYLKALQFLSKCCNDDVDPELHETYCGNALFEIAKVFIRQRDIVNANEFIQRAVDNNFSSKRLNLYKDFTEGVVYLMKRKIKKGVQILTDLLEILVNGQKESENQDKIETGAKTRVQRERYHIRSSESQLFRDMKLDKKKSLNLGKEKDEEAGGTYEMQSTIGQANQIASGKFNQEMYNFLILNIYTYRSYGYVAIEKYEHVLEDLREAKRISASHIDKATIYNKWLSRGILKMDTEEYLMASKYFGKASIRFKENKDAFCLNVISIVRSYSFSMKGLYIDNEQKNLKLRQTRDFLDVAIECCCKDQKQPSLYFFRGLLSYQLHDFYDALGDFNTAIQEEEEATGQFHLARGRCYACLSILDEALKDLSIALELDESLFEAYIFRGKCAYLLGDNNLAFHDFQKLIISDQKNPIVHIYAGNLLMTTGAYNDAIKAFDNADTVQQTALASFQRIRCYCALSDLESAFEQMQLCQHLAPNEKFAQYDYKVLLPLLSCVRSFEFSKDDNGDRDPSGFEEQTSIISNCIAQISGIISRYESEEHLNLPKNESPMSIQIIPNVNKIKIEKRIIAENQEGLEKQPELTKKQRKELDAVQEYGYYRENIFQLEEMYLYRSIFNTYVGNYEEAIKDLNLSWKQHYHTSQQAKKDAVKSSNKNEMAGIETNLDEEMFGRYTASQLVSPMSVQSQTSHKTDLSDIGLCSLNVREYNYNIIINLIQLKRWDEALRRITDEITQAPSNNEIAKSIKQLYLLRAMVYQELGQSEKYQADLTIYMKNFQKIHKNSQNAVIIEPFDVKGRLCQQFQPIRMNFRPPKTKGAFSVWMRPSFSMPFIKPPNMIPNIDEEEVQNEFNLKQIDAPMPETPWNRRCKNQRFDPFKYLELNTPSEAEDLKNSDPVGKPYEIPSETQKFIKKYLQRDSLVIYDEKVAEDIDDLSDADKVSLISEIDLDELAQACKETDKEQINKLSFKNVKKQDKKNAIHPNGVKLTSQKYLCDDDSDCSSCYEFPFDPNTQSASCIDQLMENLRLEPHQVRKARKEITDTKHEDTVSEKEEVNHMLNSSQTIIE